MAMAKENNRKIYIIAAVVIVVILIGVFVWYQFFQDDTVTNQNVTVTTNNANIAVVNATVNATPAVSGVDAELKSDALQLERLAKLFTERFGSYSTDAEYQNILDLRPYMTNKMQVWAEDYVKIQLAREENTTMNRIVTIVASTQEQSVAGIQASMRLSTQRTESGTNEETYYQEIVLDFIKDGQNWLVDSATWQDKGVITTPESPTNTNTDTTVDLFNSNTDATE